MSQGARGRPRDQPWQRPRPSPALQPRHRSLEEFLEREGHGYSTQSVAAAVRRANADFGAREVGRAAEAYGVAYELARLTFDYRPLLFDVAIRRALCCSMMGADLAPAGPVSSRAWEALEVAEQIIPNTSVVKVLKGLICMKAGLSQQEERDTHLTTAVEWLQSAVSQHRAPFRQPLEDFVECLQAHAALSFGDCDGAIQICSKVLSRSGSHAFALLVRGDACKFHVSGHFEREAAEDYAAVLRLDATLQPLLGMHFQLTPPTRLEELTLRFHPSLDKQGPRPYEEYPMYAAYSRRQYFFVAAWVVHFVASLRVRVRSSRLRRSVQVQSRGLWRHVEERTTALAELESTTGEVWGPYDPDSQVKRYRRYWMEMPRPSRSPRREQKEGGAELARADACGAPPSSDRKRAPQAAGAKQPAPPAPAPPACPGAAALPAGSGAPVEGCASGMPAGAFAPEPPDMVAVYLSKTNRYPLDEPFVRTGEGWSAEEWAARALRLAGALDGASGALDDALRPRAPPEVAIEPPLATLEELRRRLQAPGWLWQLDQVTEFADPVPFAARAEPAVALGELPSSSCGRATVSSRLPRYAAGEKFWESTAGRCGGWQANLRA